MKFKTLTLSTISVFAAISFANAESGEVVVEEIVEEPTEIGAEVSIGYDSTYFFRGIDFGRHAGWFGLDYTIPSTPLAIGLWYINPTDASGAGFGDGDELDLYASIGHSFGDVDVWLGYTAYIFPEAGTGNTNEVGVGAGYSLMGLLDLGIGVYYDWDLETWYIQGDVGKSFEITDIVSLELSASLGYEDVSGGGSDFTHVDLRASLPIAITERATVTPYVAGVIALNAREAFQDDEVYGGVSLAVSF